MSLTHTETLNTLVISALEDIKAVNIHQIDISSLGSFTDIMIFASGTSTRHVKSIAQSVIEAAKKAQMPPMGVEGEDVGDWVLVDLGDVVVHVMLPDTREFYDIERLWNDQLGKAQSS